MVSVDLFGFRRLMDNPAANFIYLNGEQPSRDSVVKAIKAGHTIAATGFDEADITLCGHLPGDEVSYDEAKNGELEISAKVMRENIKKLRVYSGAEVIYSLDNIDKESIDMKISLEGMNIDKFIRVEIEGLNEHWICNSTPFYIK